MADIRCKTEQECTHEPWCRINGECGKTRTPKRKPDPGQQWKCGDEFLPFHPSASHIPPDYRDGWNNCYWMAAARGVTAPRGGKP
jgi:hypothetical protein